MDSGLRVIPVLLHVRMHTRLQCLRLHTDLSLFPVLCLLCLLCLLLQLTGELVSQQGIVLARTTRTWVPKPRPLFFRVADFFIFGPWRALGFKDDTVRVQMPLFDGFQNPQPPPGGWGSVAGLNPAKTPAAAGSGECLAPGSMGVPGSSSSKGSRVTGGAASDGWAAAAAEGADVAVAGPRAMWLRVTMIGRSAGYGPPKVYRAAAHLHTQLSEWRNIISFPFRIHGLCDLPWMLCAVHWLCCVLVW
jgi:hypothetical protein